MFTHILNNSSFEQRPIYWAPSNDHHSLSSNTPYVNLEHVIWNSTHHISLVLLQTTFRARTPQTLPQASSSSLCRKPHLELAVFWEFMTKSGTWALIWLVRTQFGFISQVWISSYWWHIFHNGPKNSSLIFLFFSSPEKTSYIGRFESPTYPFDFFSCLAHIGLCSNIFPAKTLEKNYWEDI